MYNNIQLHVRKCMSVLDSLTVGLGFIIPINISIIKYEILKSWWSINHTVKLNKLYKYITENLWTYVQLYDILLLHGKFSNPNQNAHNLSIPWSS